MGSSFFNDLDTIETDEWIQSIDSVIANDGIERSLFLLKKITDYIKYKKGCNLNLQFFSDYVNSIPVENEPEYPGNLKIEKSICSAIRWNAIIMVLKAAKKKQDLGGHLSSFQSSAVLYEVCFNHIFKGSGNDYDGDLIYFQGHISPGIYSRAYLEGRISSVQLDNFRQELQGNGLSSYPHPMLMPNFWQFPTVSMGLGSICAIYQAKFLKYLNNRGLKDTTKQTVYVFLGDGEMDEPESKGVINIASRENLDNLIFVVNCNLQRLDGPVLGNGKIVNELESFFIGAGWEVIKVLWGSSWDALFQKDYSGKLTYLMNETLDGDYQNFKSKNGAYIRKFFFGKYKETKKLVENMTDTEIWNLERGGHDFKKVYAAFVKAKSIVGKPVVILAHTVKGYGLGLNIESKNIAHQVKNINMQDLHEIYNHLNISIKKKKIDDLPYIKFNKKTDEYKYIHKQRKKLNGYLPQRLNKFTKDLQLPKLSDFEILLTSQKKKISTTIAFIRFLNILIKKTAIKKIIVPIIADEARTFGMEDFFRQIGIYNFKGQNYIPQDKEQLSYYKESVNGQILQEGINELGATASWLAAATSYSTNNLPMIPFYIYYSMFGFQRTGDLLWAAGDQQARGFLIGGTSGRTTLNGEGLQHQDGHSHIQSLTIPNCISYNPAYAYEIAVIINDGLRRMYGIEQENIYYYITTSNENYLMPAMPKGAELGICKGIYQLSVIHSFNCSIQLLGSGSILRIINNAAKILLSEYNIGSYIYSVTSFTELARNGQDCVRWNMLNPDRNKKKPYVAEVMNNFPAVAATDFMKLFAEQIRDYVPSEKYFVLGTDGFGLSDSRKNLRNYFEINEYYIVVASLFILSDCGYINKNIVSNAIIKFNIDVNKINPRLF
ncbi:pyruvate dehydrogenase (acetyl-transferring), homodimeric type [Buchnera aphidicola (Mollitrichosiphum nigrofasciatum)]|uniref:pyruvate dehydrogenase (acetyl-transferring), homodimeric type n=1 Tax=Buchnera aphidicola TaxID=9 RepID=UPI0031B88D4E